MKKVLFVILLVISQLYVYANISAVDQRNLPTNKAFTEAFSLFKNNSQYISNPMPNWNYSIPKELVLKQTQDFEKMVDTIEGEKNEIDICLLHIIILRYLYNFDIPYSAEKIEKIVKILSEKYPTDYRVHWVYGNFLCSKGAIESGVFQFIDVLQNATALQVIHPDFFEDFAYGCFLGQMYTNGIYALNIAADMQNKSVYSYKLYQILREHQDVIDIDRNYQDSEIWSLIKDRKGNSHFLSYALGSSLPFKDTWSIKCTGLTNKQTFFMIKPDKLKSKTGTEIGISLLVNYDISGKKLNSYISSMIEKMPITNKETKEYNHIKYQIYYFEDKTKYTNMGGAKGILAFTSMPKSEYSNIDIEYPISLQKSQTKNQPEYLQYGKRFCRVDNEINISVMLDSCNDVFPESESFFTNFLENSIFE